MQLFLRPLQGVRDIIAMRYFMRKLCCFLLCIGLLAGCASTSSSKELMMAAYEGYYRSVEGNERFQSGSDYYQIYGEMTKIGDGSYRYYVFLDEPQIAMYDVVMLAVENDTPFDDATTMMPSIGIFEKTEYSLIPNQARSAAGYVKGLVISGESQQASVDLKLLVEWRDKTKKNSYREYIAFTLTPAGYEAEGDVSQEETAHE